MTGLMAFRGTSSISSRMARVERLPIFSFIGGAYSLSYGIKSKGRPGPNGGEFLTFLAGGSLLFSKILSVRFV